MAFNALDGMAGQAVQGEDGNSGTRPSAASAV